MTTYLEFRHILAIHQAVCDVAGIRDAGAIEAACGRPAATAFGGDAYPSIWEKAAALLQSLACNHGFIEGNKRTAWAATMTFLVVNGYSLEPDPAEDEAVELTLAVATGHLRDIPAIASELVKFCR